MNISELFNIGDILWHVFNTLVLFIGLRFLLYRPVRKFMDARTERLKAQQEKASSILADAQAQQRHSKELVQQAATEASTVLSNSAVQAQAQADAIMGEAQAKAKAILEQAQVDAQQIRQKNMEAMQEQAVSLAVDISSKILEREISASDHEEIIEEFLTKVK